MPPRHHTLPPAQTPAAREAQRAFYCSLCSKGYSRMNDYEAHLSSYDHAHKQRLRDMKAMVRDPAASSRARKAEAKADGLVSVKLAGEERSGGGGGGGGGFKKGGFKKSGFKSAFAPVEGAQQTAVDEGSGATATGKTTATTTTAPARPSLLTSPSLAESDTEDEGYEVYDPRYPTD
ncbi:G patch domain-containing protein-like protein [Hapsidospora chrysogenum ATCC 11550]|uniref:G patch domain-containing protein-like protein n=1 Tax=Hapsidospora chrysogenum (strain ATCC 11550 / CBS 779.69 / DSM 880 / IAM 14645 / JCM 23072 / IMI 49137) TaxID=857340 RepID=A0A086SZL2_HAPC1|nr:G patch domain-containing protein-like protein [Hapsidospora chrysogenum ATCC 11550]